MMTNLLYVSEQELLTGNTEFIEQIFTVYVYSLGKD